MFLLYIKSRELVLSSGFRQFGSAKQCMLFSLKDLHAIILVLMRTTRLLIVFIGVYSAYTGFFFHQRRPIKV